jgi:hypothetical protein
MKCHGFTVLVFLIASWPVLVRPAVGSTISDANVTACDYDALGPGGYFQGQGDPYGNPCMSNFTFNGPSDVGFSYTIHPGFSGESGQPSGGTAAAIPGANESSVLVSISELRPPPKVRSKRSRSMAGARQRQRTYITM